MLDFYQIKIILICETLCLGDFVAFPFWRIATKTQSHKKDTK